VNRFTVYRRCLVIGLAAVTAFSGDSAAQRTPDPCNVESCALRLEGGLSIVFLPPKIIRGGEPGISLGRTRPNESHRALFAANDSSAAYYNGFNRNYRIAFWGRVLGLVVAVPFLLNPDGEWSTEVGLVGLGLNVASYVPYQRAIGSLRGALRSYNGGLPR
jgi:hypothetical protein